MLNKEKVYNIAEAAQSLEVTNPEAYQKLVEALAEYVSHETHMLVESCPNEHLQGQRGRVAMAMELGAVFNDARRIVNDIREMRKKKGIM